MTFLLDPTTLNVAIPAALGSLLIAIATYALLPQLPTWRRIIGGAALIFGILLFIVAVMQPW